MNNENDGCKNELGQYPLLPSDIVDQITPEECDSLKANTGLDGQQKDNCVDLASMICDIKQEVDFLASQQIVNIAANEDSKCRDNDDPTLHAMMARILRFSQSASCILCAYDPFIATLFKMGKYPQVLMGATQEGGYPQWVDPDKLPTEGSQRPVSSEGIQQAIKDALLGVWHPWEEHPKFTYFAQTLNNSSDAQNLTVQSAATPPANGDTALVANDGTHTNALYTYTNGAWVFTRVLDNANDNLTNFAVTNIEEGYYATKDVYYFYDGTNDTWQVMDTDLTGLQKQVNELKKIFDNAVLGQGAAEQYLITTRPTLAQAQAVPCTAGKTTITLITG